MKISQIKSTYLIYTLSFLLLLPIVFLPFIQEGKSFVWHIDGLYQHYPLLQYYGELLRGILTGAGFPMIDYKLGLGFDTITTIHYYALGDPIALLTVFMTPANGATIYTILVLLRFYLIGISFILFCNYWGKKGLGVSLGALLYIFCGYAYFAGPRHPYFLNPMIYLPLILLGLEKILRKQKPYLLIIMVFISTISNFYFFYMLSIIAVIYVIFRYFYIYYTNIYTRQKKAYIRQNISHMRNKKFNIKHEKLNLRPKNFHKRFKNEDNIFTGFLITGLRTGGYYLLGIAMAGIIFIPVIYAFLQNGRLNSKPEMTTSLFHYGIGYYSSLVHAMFISGIKLDYWAILSFSSVSILSIVILFCNKKYRQLQIIFLLCFTCLSIPYFGYLMNGFAYLSNRWVFLISFLIAVTFTATYDKLFQLEKKEKLLLLGSLIVYVISAFLLHSTIEVKYELIIIFIVTTSVIILQTKWNKNKFLLQKMIVYMLVISTLGLNGYLLYSSKYTNYVNQFIDQDKVKLFSEKGGLSLIPEINDNAFYRIETYGDNILNDGARVGFHEVAGYYSIMDGSITAYLKNLELLSQQSAYRFDSMDNRVILDELENVKYFVTTKKMSVPFGFQLVKEIKKNNVSYYLYKNQYSLPLGYVYDSYLLEEEYSKLSALEKQSAMMSAVILKDKNNYAIEYNNNNELGIDKLDVTITSNKNAMIINNKIHIKKAGAKVILDFKSNPNTETYVRFNNLRLNTNDAKKITFKIKGTNGVTKKVVLKNKYHPQYFGKQDYLINLGYCSEGETKAIITFEDFETFYYDNIEVYSLDMNYYQTQATKLRRNTLNEVKMEHNLIQGNITLDKKGIMVLGIPFSSGWKAYVDGVITEIQRANIMNMAIPLEEGEHHITLKYKTPYLKVGSIVSTAAFLIFIGIVIYNKRSFKTTESNDQTNRRKV